MKVYGFNKGKSSILKYEDLPFYIYVVISLQITWKWILNGIQKEISINKFLKIKKRKLDEMTYELHTCFQYLINTARLPKIIYFQ